MSKKGAQLVDSLEAFDGPELVIGLVGPVGAQLSIVISMIKKELKNVRYDIETIRVSSLLHQLDCFSNLPKKCDGISEYSRIRKHMKAGTKLRTKTNKGDIMAFMAISEIRRRRAKRNKKEGKKKNVSKIPSKRTAYILRSLKHPDEITTLRDVYGDSFIAISIYSPRECRVTYLADIISRSEQGFNINKYRQKAEKLIDIDESEENNKLGQDVSDAFPLADLFVDVRNPRKLKSSIKRFFQAFFGYPYHTPTKDEFSMYMAQTAAYRSADLARQVGAAVIDNAGEIQSLGWNDVPKAHGGLYCSEDKNDTRDFILGYDSSVKYKSEIITEIVRRLSEHGWIDKKKKRKNIEKLSEQLITGDDKQVLDDAQVTNLLEYGRSVHAEMAAISDASRRGKSLQSNTLFCTTFPCHLCARHIIASGIRRVVYIEPYPKSQTKQLYSDSVEIDPTTSVKEKVIFEPFMGIAPRKFLQFFEHQGKRKSGKNGRKIEWLPEKSNPRIKIFALTHLIIEEQIVAKILPAILSRYQLELTSE
ncbi:MAG: deaminase [Candidatus Thiodiazotropha taylori]|nr:deaminase [Candidatus Thiodiazotropha taylori]